MDARTGMIMAAMLSGIVGCSSPQVRAVPDVTPPVRGHEILLSAQTDAGAFSTAERNAAANGSFKPAAVIDPVGAQRQGVPRWPVEALVDDLPETESLSWAGEGWPLEVDLGTGEFPYDDTMHPVDGAALGRAGFSNSIIRLTWRESLAGPFGVHGTAALSRAQDDPLLETLSDMRLSWLAVGVHASF